MTPNPAPQALDAPSPRPLDGRYFHSPEVFAFERKRLFSGHWLCAGHVSELVEEGDYFTRYLGQEPLLFARSSEGIHGFYNVCRHRGTRLVEAECGRGAKNFQCPYHAWTYGLNGTLLGAPRMRGVAAFDPKTLPLISIPTQVWNGFVFYRLPTAHDDGDSQSVSEQMSDFPDISAYGSSDLVSTSRRRYEVNANWKLLCQNYSECYHCALVHPQLNDISHYLSGGDQQSGDCFVGGPMTLNDGKNTMNMTGVTQRPSLPGIDSAQAERDVLFYVIYPNFFLSLHRDYLLSHVLWPTGPETTTIVCDWLFHRDEAKEPDFDDASEVEFWHTTNEQDWNICSQTQLGVRSQGYRPEMYQEGESCLAEFDRWYLSAMSD